jgi:hypothetical protein
VRRLVRGWIGATAVGLAAISATAAANPELEVRAGSSVIVDVAGAQRPIKTQMVPLSPAWQSGVSLRSVGSLEMPRVGLAFGEYLDLGPNQEIFLTLDPVTGAGTIEFPLWVLDSDGNGIELPTTLTTGVPTTTDCSNFPFCLGIPGDPAHCQGSAWNLATGEIRFVGATLVPSDSGTSVNCAGVSISIEATIPPGDSDSDGLRDAVDNCPTVANVAQDDLDDDGIGDACDNCAQEFNPAQADGDADGIGNACQGLNVNFQPAGRPIPPGFVMDAGLGFSQASGMGWMGGGVGTVDRELNADQRLDTLAWTIPSKGWEAVLRPGVYDLTLAIGDEAVAQGPQAVGVEQQVAIDSLSTAAGEHLFAELDAVTVSDGRLTLEVGGAGGATVLNYVTATEPGDRPFLGRHINFQPADSAIPEGFEVDSGLVFDDSRGYGWLWDSTIPTVDRAALGDKVLDTLIYTVDTTRTWEIELPSDYYDIRISLGDALAQGPQGVVVEGETWLEGQTTAAGEFITVSGRARVGDGALTVTIGLAQGVTVMNSISMISVPRDVDGDGVPNLNDNCIDDPNPDQADSDGDGSGDVCSVDSDGDGWADPLDNCPIVANPEQTNGDGDIRGDLCDCAPQDATVYSVPVEVELLLLAGDSGGGQMLGWTGQSAESGSGTVFDVATGTLSLLQQQAGFSGASCILQDSTATNYADARLPAIGDGYYYLVRGDNACGAGSYGVSLSVARAALDASGPCP